MGSRRLPSLLLLAFGLLAVTLALSWSVGQLDEPARANPQVSPDDDPSWGPVDAPGAEVRWPYLFHRLLAYQAPPVRARTAAPPPAKGM